LPASYQRNWKEAMATLLFDGVFLRSHQDSVLTKGKGKMMMKKEAFMALERNIHFLVT